LVPTTPTERSVSLTHVSDERGEFRIEGVPPGRVQVVARMAGLAPATSPRVFVEVGGESAPIELVLRPAGTLVGQVLDTRAVGVEGVLVEARSDREPHPRVVVSDAQGRFRFDAVIGEVTVTAQPREQPAVRARALVESEEETELSLTLEGELFALSGRCVDTRGFPVPDASLTLTSLRADAPLSRTLFSAADGTFEAVGLPAPPWRVRAQGPMGLAPTQLDVFEASQTFTVTLDPGATVVASVRDAWTDTPLSGTAELIQDGLPSEVLEARVFEGALRFSRVRPGAWRLVVRSEGHLETEVAVQVRLRGQDAVDVDLEPLRLEPASTLSGTVVDALGHPVARAAVHVDEAVALTDSDGEFSLSGLSPGRVTALASHPAAGESESAPLTLRRGEESPGAVLRLPEVYDAASAPPLPPRRRGVALVPVFAGGEARIASVIAGSRADRAGLRAGDTLLRIDGDSPENARHARALLSGAVSVPAVITVVRNGEDATLVVPRESWLPD
ncbi:MAG: carboxypeptidase regulatory-like domain-containing protein, partial [Sandaracinaceae bacterium]